MPELRLRRTREAYDTAAAQLRDLGSKESVLMADVVTCIADDVCEPDAPIAEVGAVEVALPPVENTPSVDAPPPAPDVIACPNCGNALTNTVIHSLTVCPSCGRTVALIDGTASLATSAQTIGLSDATIKTLKRMRPRT